jgi:hypothetical protein
MKPEWSGNSEVGPTVTLYLLSLCSALLILTYVFAFYYW